MIQTSNTMKRFLPPVMAAAAALLLAFVGCTGETDGGSGADRAETTTPFVSDGGSGGQLVLEIEDDDITIGVGDTVPFRVRLTDAKGAGIPFARIFCDTERGISIIEPASNGISVEATNPDGYMSGVIGGLLPGSYMMECRAQNGFNSVDRGRLRIEGDVPAGFQGFPGAAGGNLGGGRIIDETPDVDDGIGLRVMSFRLQDAGGPTSLGPIDIVPSRCVTDTGDICTTTCSSEPFTFTSYQITLKNDTNENVIVQTVEFRLGSNTVVAAQGQALEVKSGGGTAVLSGIFTTRQNCTSNLCYNSGGSSALPVSAGTRNHTIIVTGVSEAGNSFEVTKSVALQFDAVNNCSSGEPERTSLQCPTAAQRAACTTTTTTTT